MGRNNILTKKRRLDELLGLLKSQDYWKVIDLSKLLNVSVRTLHRDLNDLIELGIPIEADRGRGGGVRLNRMYGLGRVDFNYEEIIDLILALSTLEKINESLFFQNMKSLKNKLLQAFPEDQRSSVKELRKRIFVGGEASIHVKNSYELKNRKFIKLIHKAFFEKKKILIEYRREDGELNKRVIQPQYLLLNWPIWYILAWDELRNDTRNFRIDRISYCKLLEEEFEVLSIKKFGETVERFFTNI